MCGVATLCPDPTPICTRHNTAIKRPVLLTTTNIYSCTTSVDVHDRRAASPILNCWLTPNLGGGDPLHGSRKQFLGVRDLLRGRPRFSGMDQHNLPAEHVIHIPTRQRALAWNHPCLWQSGRPVPHVEDGLVSRIETLFRRRLVGLSWQVCMFGWILEIYGYYELTRLRRSRMSL